MASGTLSFETLFTSARLRSSTARCGGMTFTRRRKGEKKEGLCLPRSSHLLLCFAFPSPRPRSVAHVPSPAHPLPLCFLHISFFPQCPTGAGLDDGQHQHLYAVLARTGHQPPRGASSSHGLWRGMAWRTLAFLPALPWPALIPPPSPQRNRLDVEKWIEALDPLQAGSILSKEGMRAGGGPASGGRRRSGSVLF